MKLPELPLLDELCRAVTSAKIPAVRLNQDGRRAERRFVKSGQDSVAAWMDGSTVEYHEMRSSRNREKKSDG